MERRDQQVTILCWAIVEGENSLESWRVDSTVCDTVGWRTGKVWACAQGRNREPYTEPTEERKQIKESRKQCHFKVGNCTVSDGK